MNLRYNHNKESFSFFLQNESNEIVPFVEWDRYTSDFLSEISILNELKDNGFAQLSDNHLIIDNPEILSLNYYDKQILGLPNNYPYEIYIESDGILTHESFKFKYGFFDFCPNGTRLKSKRNGAIIQINESEYLLTENQYKICEAIDEFNSLSTSEKGKVVNLMKLSTIKTLSKESGAVLEHFLNNQELYVPDRIKIDIDLNNGFLEIIPTIDVENSISFINKFDLFPKILDTYPIQNEKGGTTRIVLTKNQQKELENIKKKRKISDKAMIDNIVNHPEQFFDDNIVDFSVFYSERVKEIGIYSPKFYPFVCPYKSQWIPGLAIKDKIHGEKRIHFKTESELTAFENKKNIAIKEGTKSFSWKDTEIPVEDAENFICIAKKQFKSPKAPLAKEEHSRANEVLIIKENADLLEYIEDIPQLIEFTHSFHQIENLNAKIKLKEHQIEGIAWLQSLYKGGFNGCLLADDMGLGKTLQLLYFIEWHSQNNNDSKPYLVVSPVSLLENWENEYSNFFVPSKLTISKLYGQIALSKEFDEARNKKDAQKLQHKHIILTNYETLREYQAALCLVDFALVVLDEAQKIKTPGTLITNVCKALKADFKIAMTGTPVENTLVDLWCIMDFSVPGLLGNAKEFAKEFQNPLKNEETNVKDLGEILRKKIGVFIKRRLKKDVAKDLPSKIEYKNSTYKKEMPKIQLDRYKVEMELAKNVESTGIDRRNQILKSLWAIRDISDHPFLVDNQIGNYKTDELVSSSAKLQIICSILDKVKKNDEKAIVFADRKETQKLLQKVIFDIFGVFPSIVNGETPTTKKAGDNAKLSRQQTIDRFQSENGFNVIVMSQLAAGVGLNVTKANHVIHYTRHWNPAKESQATDRAYRIGQLKDVHVYYPMAVFPSNMKSEDGTKLQSFDEILDHLLSLKNSLATNTLFPTEQAEVRPDEIFGNVFGFNSENKPSPLDLEQVDNLNPNLFEAFIAALYKIKGFDVYLTPNSNDKGADVVAVNNNEDCLLIQAKQCKSNIGIEAIQEIYGAKNYYESKFNERFKLVVITNSMFSQAAITLATSNNVCLINRTKMHELMTGAQITIQDIYKIETDRMKSI